MKKKEVYFYVKLRGKITKATDFSLYLDEWLRPEVFFKVKNKSHYVHFDSEGISIGFTKEEANISCDNIFVFEKEYKKLKRALRNGK